MRKTIYLFRLALIIFGAVLVIGYISYRLDTPMTTVAVYTVDKVNYPTKEYTKKCEQAVREAAEEAGVRVKDSSEVKTQNLNGKELRETIVAIYMSFCSAPTGATYKFSRFEQRPMTFQEILATIYH